MTIGGTGFGLVCLCLFAFAAVAGTAGAASCPNEAIRQQQGTQRLPECRAYEQVSPIEKGGVDVLGDTSRSFTEAGPDGDSIAYSSSSAFGDPQGAAFPSIYRAARGADGWTSSMVSPPQNATLVGGLGAGNTSLVSLFNGSLTEAIVRTNRSLAGGAGENVPNFYVSNLLTGEDRLLSPGGPTAPVSTTTAPEFGYATPDFSAAVFGSKEALTANAPADSELKTYAYRNGHLELASILPGGVPADGFPGDPNMYNSRGAISTDGTRVFFSGPNETGLWVRDMEASTTTQIVESGIEVRFLAAALDGSKVLWRGTNTATNTPSLFLYDVDQGTTEELPIPAIDPSQNFSLNAVLAASDDLSSVYFIGIGKLVVGQPAPPADSPVGNPYAIYRWQPQTDRVTFVAYAAGGSPGDSLLYEGGVYDNLANRRDVATTPDGSVLVFATGEKVMPPSGSGYENASPAPVCNNTGVGRCREVYRYDANGETLECVSCSSGTPMTNASLPAGSTVGPTSTINQRGFSQANAVSADGSKVFFETGERLAAGDTNGRDDVYMWNGGTRQLLSSGTSNYNSRLLDASPNGNDVFIVTRARLVGWDRDELADLYDVRVGGGFPEPPPPFARCVGSDCQLAAGEPPAAPTLGSAALEGPGNASCRKGSDRVAKLVAEAGRFRGKAKQMRAGARRFAARSARSDGGRAARLRRQSDRLEANAGKADKRARELTAQANRLRGNGPNCRGAK